MTNNKKTYHLIRTNRRTLAIYIRDNGSVEVRAPKRMPVTEIEGFLNKKTRWITEHQQSVQNSRIKKQHFKLNNGTNLLLLGNEVPLRMDSGLSKSTSFFLSLKEPCFCGPVDLSLSERKREIGRAYKEYAELFIPDRVNKYSKQTGWIPDKVRVGSAKTRWGSCSEKGSLNFSWVLIMAPLETIDYVVIHELCHLSEFNHSESFWNLVAQYCPEYKRHQKELKGLAKRIEDEGWLS